ncbi:MAG: hypothetical protein R2838_07675 [Caldilineaceae bacterium]
MAVTGVELFAGKLVDVQRHHRQLCPVNCTPGTGRMLQATGCAWRFRTRT